MILDKEEIINEIINKARYYGKNKLQNKIKIIIFDKCLSISSLIYMDDLSKILSLNNDVETIHIREKNTTLTKEEFNNIRINYNKCICINELNHDPEELLNILRVNNKCHIVDNCLYIDDIKIVDEEGNYTDSLYKTSYYYILYTKYNKVLVLDNDFEQYKKLLNILKIDNITNIKIELNNLTNLDKNIDKTRLDAISSNIDLNDLDFLYSNFNKILYNHNIEILDRYNNLNSNIEYNILELLKNYNDTILNVSNNLNLDIFINYVKKIIKITKKYIETIINLTIDEDKLNLIAAIKIVLNNSLDLLGVIPIYL